MPRAARSRGAALLAVLALCLARGLWFTHGLTVPPDDDITRDLGFIQGILDGDLFGDPHNAGAWRWYPPLVHALAAAALAPGVAEPMPFWVHAGPWLGLLVPLSFWAMGVRLLGPSSAVAATAVLVLFNGAALTGDVAAGYTPFTLTPVLGWAVFFAGVRLILARAGSGRIADALLIGTWLGLAFLAHTVPAVLLSTVAAAVAFAARGAGLRTAAWLAVVALTELAWGLLFVGPLLVAYRLRIANPAPGAWTHLLLIVPMRKLFLATNLPGLAAAAAVAVLHRFGPLPRTSIAALAAWVGVCLAFLARHYACGYAGEKGGACGVFVVAAHHWEAYLQAAWAALCGHALVLAARWARPRWRAWPVVLRGGLAGAGALAVAAGAAGFLLQPEDARKRRQALETPGVMLDAVACRWILRNTSPRDLFVTGLPASDHEPSTIGPSAAAAMAAGRRLVAPPELHSNPYLDWAPKAERRLSYLRGFAGGGAADLCAFAREAGAGAAAYFLLPRRLRPGNGAALDEAFHTADHSLYRVRPTVCAELGMPAADTRP
ncbi:MAG: hypothetical protein ICV73_18680 [Acetobacteraceae bacterium]|nr:hypothetical protein [Acetobacteraceae bacterium]